MTKQLQEIKEQMEDTQRGFETEKNAFIKKIEAQDDHMKEIRNEHEQTRTKLQTLQTEITRLQNKARETANWTEKLEASNRALKTLTEAGIEREIEYNRQMKQFIPGRSFPRRGSQPIITRTE